MPVQISQPRVWLTLLISFSPKHSATESRPFCSQPCGTASWGVEADDDRGRRQQKHRRPGDNGQSDGGDESGVTFFSRSAASRALGL
ncbi:unnamed protein product [Protopolystoma xenopodis]|uniref:Uncharacterized protein n=1 Tax=Protopolystoma xenopodis TaxID=117903 RepID=A0A3S5ASU4_9PLAT|nr:unnamed protein product [Protopolystoma xenopodis]